MANRYFALVLGILFLAIGAAAFIPGMIQPGPMHDLRVHGPGEGYLLGLFHVNVLHNLVHLAFGVFGIIAFASIDGSRLFARVVAVGYGVLVLFGLCPVNWVNTLWGLVPLHGNDVWLHAIIALVSAYFGWATVPQV